MNNLFKKCVLYSIILFGRRYNHDRGLKNFVENLDGRMSRIYKNHLTDVNLPGPGKRMAKKTNGQFLWRMATWPFIITRIPFLANGHGHSLGIESDSGEWPVTIKSEYSDTKKSRVE